MTFGDILFVIGLGAVAGVAIGCCGIGGVILVPALLLAGVLPVHDAIPAVMAAYVIAGIVGSYRHRKLGSLDLASAAAVCAGAMVTALLGALAAKYLSSTILQVGIAALMIASGLFVLLTGQAAPADGPPSLVKGLSVGAVTGFASALTGTGGPAVLVPLLLILRVEMLSAIALSQPIQLPIAASATIGSALVGIYPGLLAVLLGGGLGVGTFAGAELAHRLNRHVLRFSVAAIQLAVGVCLAGRIVVQSLTAA